MTSNRNGAIFGRDVKGPQSVNEHPYDQIIDALRRADLKADKHRKSIVRRLKRAVAAAKVVF